MDKLSIIWNVTSHCIWDCDFCVMDASRDSRPDELSLEEKLLAAENLRGIECRVDLSGGEVMCNLGDHMKLISRLSDIFGKDNVGISCSGYHITDEIARELSGLVSGVEMTMDAHPDRPFNHRPLGYHRQAAEATKHMVSHGVKVGIQTVLTRVHSKSPEILTDLYSWLRENRVSRWSLLRFFPYGRGAEFLELELNDSENLVLVEHAKSLCCEHADMLDIHYLLPGTNKDSRCRCVKKSVGILPDGRVTACFWGLGGERRLTDPRFLLGNIVSQPLAEILTGDNAQYWRSYYGKCPLEKKIIKEAV